VEWLLTEADGEKLGPGTDRPVSWFELRQNQPTKETERARGSLRLLAFPASADTECAFDAETATSLSPRVSTGSMVGRLAHRHTWHGGFSEPMQRFLSLLQVLQALCRVAVSASSSCRSTRVEGSSRLPRSASKHKPPVLGQLPPRGKLLSKVVVGDRHG
jgi:hypothetical protein